MKNLLFLLLYIFSASTHACWRDRGPLDAPLGLLPIVTYFNPFDIKHRLLSVTDHIMTFDNGFVQPLWLPSLIEWWQCYRFAPMPDLDYCDLPKTPSSSSPNNDISSVVASSITLYKFLNFGSRTWAFSRAVGANPFSFEPQIIYPTPTHSKHLQVGLLVGSCGGVWTEKPYTVCKLSQTSNPNCGGFVTGETFHKIVDAGHRTYELTGKSDNPWSHDMLKVIAPASGDYRLKFFCDGSWKPTCDCVSKPMQRVNTGVAITGATLHRIRAAGYKTAVTLLRAKRFTR